MKKTKKILKVYLKEVERLRSIGKDWNLTDEEIDRIIDDSFKFLETDYDETAPKKTKSRMGIFGLSVLVCILAVLFCLFFPYRKTAHNYLERNVQELIYPGMKLLRKAVLPLVRSFPSITEWYDEACLVSNPYFHVPDIDCWPCEGVRSVLNLTLTNITSEEFHTGMPFILKDDNLKEINYIDLKNMYVRNKNMFVRDAPRIISADWSTSEDLFHDRPLNINPSKNKDLHISWKLNRLEPTREIRRTFGIPKQVPNFVLGITPEKFVFIDEKHTPPYKIESMEGTTVFLVQGSGSRLIVLDPSPECRSSCHRVSVVLTPHHILWYNWWYWRATSLPIESSDTSITYLGSYY